MKSKARSLRTLSSIKKAEFSRLHSLHENMKRIRIRSNTPDSFRCFYYLLYFFIIYCSLVADPNRRAFMNLSQKDLARLGKERLDASIEREFEGVFRNARLKECVS